MGTLTKEELAFEIESADTRFMNLFGQKVNRATVKKALKYIKEGVDVQIDDTNLMALQIDGDTTAYLGRTE